VAVEVAVVWEATHEAWAARAVAVMEPPHRKLLVVAEPEIQAAVEVVVRLVRVPLVTVVAAAPA
jgi:hypothetical protein